MSIPSSTKEAITRVEIKPRYGNFIGGEFRPPAKGQYFSNPSPITGQPLCEIARGTAEDIEQALDAAHAAAPAWGRTVARRARAGPQQDRRSHRAATWSCSRSSRRSTTASRSARPWRPICRSPSITSAISPAAIRAQEGTLSRDRRRHRRLSLPRAAGRGRADHPVELPAADGDLEARAGARRRQLRGAQARRADAARSWR